jgi:hypothetical protein
MILWGNCKTPIWDQIRPFCAETEPAQKSSDLTSKASFAISYCFRFFLNIALVFIDLAVSESHNEIFFSSGA